MVSALRTQGQARHCRRCQRPFEWSVQEQEFFSAHGLAEPPKHCAACRKQRREERIARCAQPVDD
jgi:hypothetical protein